MVKLQYIILTVIEKLFWNVSNKTNHKLQAPELDGDEAYLLLSSKFIVKEMKGNSIKNDGKQREIRGREKQKGKGSNLTVRSRL